MATIRIDLASENRASQEVLKLRRQITNLSEVVARNNAATAKGTAAERAKTGEINRGIRAEQGLLRVQQQRQSQNLAGLRRENGLLANSRKQTDLLARSTNLLGGALATLGFAALASEVTQFATDSIRAGVRVEGFRNSLTALYGDAQVAEGVLNDLREAAQLPGITFQSAVQGAIRLKTVGVEGDRATAVIKEFGNAAALAGAGADEVGRSLVGFTQILSRGKISQEELNQILENVPLIGNSIREAFGSIDAEVIRDQLDAAGQGVQDFADILVNQLSKSARASADSAANAFSNLTNATFELQAAIGERLNPVVKDITTGFTELLTNITSFISGTDDATRSVEGYTQALETAGNTAAINRAITDRIEFLKQERQALEDAAEGSANYFEFRGVEQDPGRRYRELGEELDRLQTAQTNASAGITHFTNVQDQLIARASVLTGEITDLRVELAGATGREIGRVTARIREKEAALTAVSGEIETTSGALRALATVTTTVTKATDASTVATDKTKESTKELTVEVQALTEIYKGLTASVREYSDFLALIASTGAGDFFRLATGEIEGYAGGIDTATASVTNHEAELDALHNAGFYDGLTDPLADYNAELGITSVAADKAFGVINELGEAAGSADFTRAADNLRDFDDAFQLSEATIPRVTSAMREFTGTADDIPLVTEAIESTTMSVDDLLDSIEGLGSGERALDQLETSFFSISDDVVPEVTRDIIDAFVGIAEGDEIPDAFGVLGERIGDTLIDSMSDVLSDQLGGVIEDELSKVTAASLTSAGATAGIAAAVIAAITTTAIPIVDLINRAVNPPTPTDPAEIDRLQRQQIFQPGHPLFIEPPVDPRTRDVTGRTRGGTPVELERSSVRGDRRRRQPSADSNVTRFDPDPVPFQSGTSIGSELGDPEVRAERIEAEADTQERILAIQKRAIDDRLANEQRLSDAIRGIADDVVAFHTRTEERKAEISERATADRTALEETYQDDVRQIADDVVAFNVRTQEQITAVTKRATADRLALEERYNNDVQQIADDVVAFHARTEERKVEISDRATADRIQTEETYQDSVQGIADDVVAFHEQTEQRKADVSERATADRTALEETYQADVQGIIDSVVEFHTRTQEQITAVIARATADRLALEETYQDTVQGIVDDVVAFHTRTQAQITAVTKRATADRLAVEKRYEDDVQQIYDDVADRYGEAEAEKLAITKRAVQDRIRAEENLVDTVEGIISGLVDSVRSVQAQITDVEQQAIEDRISAQMDYDTEVQGIYNNLADEVTSIQERLNDELDRIGQQRVDSEADRVRAIERLNRDRGESVEDRTRELRRELEGSGVARGNEGQLLQTLLANQQAIEGGDASSIESLLVGLGNVPARLRFVLDAFQGFSQDVEDIDIATQREGVQIAEGASRGQTQLDQQASDAVTGAATDITAAETGTGTTAAEALANAVPPLDAMTIASMNLATTLTTIDTTLATDVGLFNEAITNLETNAGISFENALLLYTPSLSAMAAAGQTFADIINGIDSQELADIGAVATALNNFVAMAGVPLVTALNLASPPMTRLAVALENRETGLLGIDETETDAITALNKGMQDFVTMAGVPLTTALILASPVLSRHAQALENRETGLLGIDETEPRCHHGVE